MTVVVVVLSWAQPVAEELQAGQGNLSAVREAASATSASYGIENGIRAVATVVAPPEGWWRPSFRSFDPAGDLLGMGAAAAVLAGLALLHVVLAVTAARRGDRPTAAWLTTSVAAVAVGTMTAATSPTSGPFGAVSGNFRFLWPVAAFTTFGVAAALLRLLGDRVARGSVPLLAVVAAVLAAAALPTSYQSPGPEADAPLIPVARSLRAQVLDHELPGPVAVDRSGLFFGEPYTYVVLAALQETGIDIVLDAPTDISRFGEGRRRDGPVTGTITFAAGADALEDRAGSTLVARASLLSAQELDSLRADSGAVSGQTSEALASGTVAVWFEPSA